MPRKRRIDLPGTYHHVIVRGIERRDIFLDDNDREEYIRRLEISLIKSGCHCYAWVLMSNHFHLFIQIVDGSLTRLMRSLLSGYAVYFNRRYKRSGYLFQNRYKSVLVQEDSYFLELVRYIHLNPVRAKIVADAKGLERYRWSGHGVIVGRTRNVWQNVDEVLGRFGRNKSEAIARYRSFIQKGRGDGKRDDLTGGGLRRSAGGWEKVFDLKRNNDGWRADDRILGDGAFVTEALDKLEKEENKRDKLVRAGWNLERVIEKVVEKAEIDAEELKTSKKRSGKIKEAREMIAYLGYNELGLSSVEIGKKIGLSRQGVKDGAERGGETIEKYQVVLL